MRQRRLGVASVIVAVALLAVAAFVWAGTTKIVVEGEAHYSIKPSMAKATSEVASGGKYVHIPLRRPHAQTETEPSDDGHARYRVKVPASGHYQLWARTNWYDACGNSFFLVVDDKPATVIGQDASYRHWIWRKGPRLQLAEGWHWIKFQNREDGAKLDQFLLTTSSKYIPVTKETPTPQYIAKPE